MLDNDCRSSSTVTLDDLWAVIVGAYVHICSQAADEEAAAPWVVADGNTIGSSVSDELSSSATSLPRSFRISFLSSFMSSKPRRDSGCLSSDHVALQSGQRP